MNQLKNVFWYYVAALSFLITVIINSVIIGLDKTSVLVIVVLVVSSVALVINMAIIVTNKSVRENKLFVVLALLILPFPYVLFKLKSKKIATQESV